MPSGSRLVARIRSCGQARSRRVGQQRAGVDQVLAVVQHQQQLLGRAGASASVSSERPPRLLAHAERRGDRLGHQRRVGQRRQLHQPDAVGVGRQRLAGELQARAASCRTRRRR